MFNTQERIAEHEARIHKLQLERSQARERAAALAQHGKRYADQLPTYYTSLLAGNQQTVKNSLASLPPQNVIGWQNEQWTAWDPARCGAENTIRCGEASEQEQ